MELGTIIRLRNQINNYPKRDGERWEYEYYIYNNGPFEINDANETVFKSSGPHFISEGSTYFYGSSGAIYGLEILEGWYETVEKIPDNLIK